MGALELPLILRAIAVANSQTRAQAYSHASTEFVSPCPQCGPLSRATGGGSVCFDCVFRPGTVRIPIIFIRPHCADCHGGFFLR